MFHSSSARWVSQIEVAAEFLAHELLQQQFAHRLQRGVGQQQLHPPAAVFHVDPQSCEYGCVREAADRGEARVHLQPFEAEGDRAERVEAGGQIGQHHLDQALHQGALDRGVGTAFDAHRRGAAAAAQQHVHDRVDHRGIDHHQAVVVPLLGLEHGKHGRQRDRIQVVAEAQRQDVVDAHFDVVRGEVAQRGGHDAHQPVEHDLQHRQALVRDEAGADDLLHPGAVLAAGGTFVEAEQAIDLGLVEHARGLGRLFSPASAGLGLGLRAPRGGQFFVGLLRFRFVAHWISIWVNSTSVMRAGAAARLARRDEFLAQAVGAGGTAQLLRAHLAHIGQEQVLQARHGRLHPLDILLLRHFQPRRQLHVVRPLRVAVQVGDQLRQIDIDRRGRFGLLGGGLGVLHAEQARQNASEPEAGADADQHDRRGEQDQLAPAPGAFRFR